MNNLVYINKLGVNFRGNNVYEFLFSEDTEDIDGEDWNIFPASAGNISPPDLSMISGIGTLETEINLMVIGESDTFSVWDATDGVVALAYEDITEYEQYPDIRLVFNFGDPTESVLQLLHERDIILEIKEIDEN